MENEKPIDKFRAWLVLKELSSKTIKEYLYYYSKFPFPLSQDNTDTFLSKWNNQVARAFVRSYKEYYVSRKGQNYKDILEINIPKKTGAKKERLINFITFEEKNKMLMYMGSERNKALLDLSFFVGLRLTELMNLRASAFDFEDFIKNREMEGYEQKIRLIGKRNKEREALVNRIALIRVYNYYISEYIKKEGDDRLFKISTSSWQKIVSKASQKALGRKISPHKLRHSSAMFYIQRKKQPIEYVRLRLGHEDISTTQRYIHVKIDDARLMKRNS